MNRNWYIILAIEHVWDKILINDSYSFGIIESCAILKGIVHPNWKIQVT